MIRLPPRSTRTDTLFPYTTLFRSIGLIVNHGVEYTPANGIVNRLVKYFPTARVADQDGRLTLQKIGAGKPAASAAPAVRMVTVGPPGLPGARRGLLSRRLLVAGRLLVQIHRPHRRPHAAAGPQRYTFPTNPH